MLAWERLDLLTEDTEYIPTVFIILYYTKLLYVASAFRD